jgi:hypothetical protein
MLPFTALSRTQRQQCLVKCTFCWIHPSGQRECPLSQRFSDQPKTICFDRYKHRNRRCQYQLVAPKGLTAQLKAPRSFNYRSILSSSSLWLISLPWSSWPTTQYVARYFLLNHFWLSNRKPRSQRSFRWLPNPRTLPYVNLTFADRSFFLSGR